jgi:siroheme synthase
VPGITAALAACASAGVSLTHRECASHVTLATARPASGDPIDLAREGTIVFYMGLGTLEATLADLVRSGRAASTPAMVVSRATLPDQRIVTGTLCTLGANVRAAALEPPALVVVGDVVGRRVVSAAPRTSAKDTGT